MTLSVSSGGLPVQDVRVQGTAPNAARAMQVQENSSSDESVATQRLRHTRPDGSGARSVFAEQNERIVNPRDPRSAPPSLVGIAHTTTGAEPQIGTDIPVQIAFPNLPQGAALPSLLETEFDRPHPPRAGHSVGSLSNVSSGQGDGHVADASVASLAGSESSSGNGGIDIESQAVRPLSKEPLGRMAFREKIARANLVDAVKTHALMHPMVQLDPSRNAEFRQAVTDLLDEIDTTLAATREVTAEGGEARHIDIESGHDLTHLAKFRQQMSAGFDAVTSDLSALTEHKDAFMGFKARHETGHSSMSDKIQRNIFGSEMHAVFTRSALQSLLVVGASAGFQVATVSALQRFFTSNPDQIPAPVLHAAREQLGAAASREDVIKEAVSGLASPGSTYLDEATSTEPAIYTAEAVIGGLRGVIVPMADSINETDARAAKLQSAVDNVDQPTAAKNWKQRAGAAMSSSWNAQIKANLVSGGIAALIQTGTTKQTTGASVLIEVAKTMGFSVIAAANNVAADGFRRAVYDGKSEAVSQSLKAGARIVGRSVAQGMKTGISYAQSAAEGSLNSRSIAGDAIKATMQSAVSGGLKEVLGSAFQNATEANLPPNELGVLQAGKALGSIAVFSRGLSSMERPADLSATGQEKLQKLSYMVSDALSGVLDANAIKFESVDFDTGYQVYQSQLLQKVAEARADATGPAGGPNSPVRNSVFTV